MYKDDVLYTIAVIVFVCLTVSLVVAIAILSNAKWWLYVILIISALVLAIAYRSIAEYVMCMPAIGMLVLLGYDLFNNEIALPPFMVILIIIWEVLFIVYMVFFSFLRESIDEYRRRF